MYSIKKKPFMMLKGLINHLKPFIYKSFNLIANFVSYNIVTFFMNDFSF